MILTTVWRASTRFFALVIGIDNYASIQNLSGCVADAKDMVDYLVNSVNVPLDNIRTLYNEAATRDAIKRHMASFADDDRIGQGDPILIYFAGHGSQTQPSATCNVGASNEPIKMILPWSFTSTTNRDESRQGIPYTTIAALLMGLASAKGDNLVSCTRI